MNGPAIDVSQVQCFTHLQTGCGCFPVMSTKQEQFFWGGGPNIQQQRDKSSYFNPKLDQSNPTIRKFHLICKALSLLSSHEYCQEELTQRYVCLCKEVIAYPHMWEAASTNVETISGQVKQFLLTCIFLIGYEETHYHL